MISVLVLFVALFLHPATSQQQPTTAGLVGVGTTRLFEYVGDIALDIVRHHITSAHLGSVTTTVSAPLLGDVDVTLTDIYLQNLNATHAVAHVAPQPDGSVALTLHHIAVHVQCPLLFRRKAWPHISGHGTAYINAYDGHVVLVGTVRNDGAGRPHVQLLPNTSSVHFDDMDVRIADTKAAFLFNIVLLIAHEYVEARIQQEVCVCVFLGGGAGVVLVGEGDIGHAVLASALCIVRCAHMHMHMHARCVHIHCIHTHCIHTLHIHTHTHCIHTGESPGQHKGTGIR